MNINQTTKELHTYRILLLCAIVILLEGFDIQAAGVSAPKLSQVINLTSLGKGLFLGASAVGIFLSAILGGFLADKFGRRPVVISGVVIFGLFSLSTLFAEKLGTLIATRFMTGMGSEPSTTKSVLIALIAARFMTGMGLGAAMPIAIAYASDHSPVNMKKRAVGFIYCAIPIGGLLSGVVMQSGMFGSDWHSVYLVGGIAPLVVAPFLLLLPKSLPRAKNILESTSKRLNIFSGLLGDRQFYTTIFLWMSNFGTLLVMYLLLTWMPSLLVAMGIAQSQSQYIQMLFNVGMSIGAVTGGYLLDRKFLYSTPGTAFVGLAMFLTVFGFIELDFTIALMAAFGMGAMIAVAQTTLYAFAPLCYPASMRNTGVGAAIAAGRLGTIAGPLLAGTLLDAGKTAQNVLTILIPITIVSGIMSLLVVSFFSRRNTGTA